MSENNGVATATRITHGKRVITPGPTVAMPHGGVMDRVESLGWTVVDKPGEFALIPKGDLNVDHAYQRDRVANARVNEIASRWSWLACGTLCVARRPDASLWVVDGQHRKLAADRRSDIATLPCLVFAVVAAPEEAAGFRRANTARTAISSHALWKAGVAAGDAEAIAIKAFVEASGYRCREDTVADFSVICLAELVKQHRADPACCRRIFALCAELAGGKLITRQLFGSLCRLEQHMVTGGHGSLCEQPHAGRLAEAGVEALAAAMDRRAAQVAKVSSKAWADGALAFVLNRGRRNKIPSLFLADAGDS